MKRWELGDEQNRASSPPYSRHSVTAGGPEPLQRGHMSPPARRESPLGTLREGELQNWSMSLNLSGLFALCLHTSVVPKNTKTYCQTRQLILTGCEQIK